MSDFFTFLSGTIAILTTIFIPLVVFRFDLLTTTTREVIVMAQFGAIGAAGYLLAIFLLLCAMFISSKEKNGLLEEMLENMRPEADLDA